MQRWNFCTKEINVQAALRTPLNCGQTAWLLQQVTHLKSNSTTYPDVEEQQDEVGEVDEHMAGYLRSGETPVVIAHIVVGILQVAPTWKREPILGHTVTVTYVQEIAKSLQQA